MVFACLEYPCLQLSTFCVRRPTCVPPKDCIFLGPQIAVFEKTFSAKKSPSGVRRNNSERSFTVSYLINSVGLLSDGALSVSDKSPPDVCRNDSVESFTVSYLINSVGFSPEEALTISKELRIKSPKKPDAVLELLREYGFTGDQIRRLVVGRPCVLLASTEKTLLPKLEFFCSIGVPLRILAHNLSFHPTLLHCSLENYIIPWYNCLKSVVKSDKKVARVFWRAPRVFKSVPAKIAFLRQQGLPDTSIASLLAQNPSLMYCSEEKVASYIDRAVQIGFDKTKVGLIRAIQVFGAMSESTLNHKMDLYMKWGWSESDMNTAFLKDPICMKYSEKKIMANMDFLINKMGLKPTVVAQRPSLLSYSVEKRLRPRYLVARILDALELKKMVSVTTLFTASEELFLKRYIVNYEDDVPQLLDIYQGKLSLPDVGFSREVIEKILDFENINTVS